MKTPKTYLDELPVDDTNMLCEPEMAYSYANQNDCETVLVGKFDEIKPRPQKILQPDDDLRRAITIDELLVGIHDDIRKKFALRK
jgi:hypothetical protein